MLSTSDVFIRKNGQANVVRDFGGRAPQIFRSHEFDHAVHIPTEEAEGFDLSKLPRGIREYFSAHNNTDLAARGSQIKDYFGIKDPNLPITADMLKSAAENYVKDTGVNNNMTEFFHAIKDWGKAAKWLSKYATGIALPVTGYGLYNANE